MRIERLGPFPSSTDRNPRNSTRRIAAGLVLYQVLKSAFTNGRNLMDSPSHPVISNFAVKPARKGERRRAAWPAASLALLLLAAVAIPPSASAAQPALAKVTVKTAPVGSEIPRGFVGISLEVSAQGQALPTPPKNLQMGPLAHPSAQHDCALGHPGEPNTGFFRFMRNLGPATLRLGGNSEDNTCWDAK
jgi:hypothetical protein